MTTTIRLARSDEDVRRCFPVMRQLRPHLNEDEFVGRVRLQEQGGYEIAFLEGDAGILAVAGFRIIENLSAGRVLYVDDLVTDAAHRSSGHGRRLLEWLAEAGRERGCAKLDLDSGVQRVDAHRFYDTNGMIRYAHHFRMDL